MSQARALYRLQKLDQALDAHRNRLREITALLESDEALQKAEKAVTQVQQDLRPQEVRANDLNLELKSVSAQTTQLTDRLYGGTVNNPKELEDIQEKVAERKRRHAELENRLLETMIAIEDLQAALAEAQARASAVRAESATEREALLDEAQRRKREYKQLKTERDAALAQVEPDSLTLYTALRAKKQGTAVSVLRGETCATCGVAQTTTLVQRVRQDQDLVRCASCGRILLAG